jgi:site-specific DNA recombinase
VIVVHKLDRFSRSLADVVRNVARLREAGVGLVSVSEPWLDTTTPQGEFTLYLFALLAQWDDENRARETFKGKQQRAKEGYWNGSLSFGYVTLRDLRSELWRIGEQHDAGEIEEAIYAARSEELENHLDQWHDRTEGDAVPDLKNAAGALLAYTYYSQGNVSDNDVAILLNEAGYRTSGNWGERLFEADTVRPMLQNRFYLGEVQYKGKWMPGRHPALIPRVRYSTNASKSAPSAGEERCAARRKNGLIPYRAWCCALAAGSRCAARPITPTNVTTAT